MARVNSVGLEKLAREIQQRGEKSRATVERMLNHAGDEIAKATQISAEMHGLRDSGKMIDSIKPGPLEISSDSARVEIWPQGSGMRGRKKKRSVRNALVGFIQHYGRSYGRTKRAGTGFFDEAVNEAAELAINDMIDIWREEEGL